MKEKKRDDLRWVYISDNLRWVYRSYFSLFFLSTFFSDDLRCFFSFFLFFRDVVLVCLARDGCLVRSWCGGRAAGGAAGRRGSEVFAGLLQKHPATTALAKLLSGFFWSIDFLFLPLKKQVKIYTNSIKTRSQKSRLKVMQCRVKETFAARVKSIDYKTGKITLLIPALLIMPFHIA